MEAAGNLVAAAAELAAGVEDGEHHRHSGQAGLVLHAHRDATAVVGNIHHVSGQQAHLDLVAKACQGFVDGVVHDLIHQVVKAPGACGANVHTRALAHCLQAFQHLDLVAVIGFFRLCHVGHFVNFQARTLL